MFLRAANRDGLRSDPELDVALGVSCRVNSSIVWLPAFRDYPALMAFGRRQYPFHLIEPKWQHQWDEQQTFRAWNPGKAVPSDHGFAERHGKARPEQLPKFYILDMFPYPDRKSVV